MPTAYIRITYATNSLEKFDAHTSRADSHNSHNFHAHSHNSHTSHAHSHISHTSRADSHNSYAHSHNSNTSLFPSHNSHFSHAHSHNPHTPRAIPKNPHTRVLQISNKQCLTAMQLNLVARQSLEHWEVRFGVIARWRPIQYFFSAWKCVVQRQASQERSSTKSLKVIYRAEKNNNIFCYFCTYMIFTHRQRK